MKIDIRAVRWCLKDRRELPRHYGFPLLLNERKKERERGRIAYAGLTRCECSAEVTSLKLDINKRVLRWGDFMASHLLDTCEPVL